MFAFLRCVALVPLLTVCACTVLPPPGPGDAEAPPPSPEDTVRLPPPDPSALDDSVRKFDAAASEEELQVGAILP